MSALLTPRRIIVALLVLHVTLILIGIRLNFVTIDEACHIPSGIVHWEKGWFTPYQVNPPLPRMLATAALLPLKPQIGNALPHDVPGLRPEWDFGTEFADANKPHYFDLVCLARLAGIGWALLGVWLVYAWARDLYGTVGGCLALALWCIGPNVLAHAALVTPDFPATVAGLAASYALWHYLRQPSWLDACLAGLLLGVALLTKFTLLVLYGVWPVLALLYWSGRNRTHSKGLWLQRGGQGLLIGVLSVVVVNIGYGFSDTGRPLGSYRFVSRLFTTDRAIGEEPSNTGLSRNRFGGTWLGRLPVPFPSAYLLGIDLQRRDFERELLSYLDGQWHSGGRWYFYLYALALKVPLGTLVLVLAGFLLAVFRHPASGAWRDEAVLWLPALILLVFVSSQTGLNYFRYLLPAFPFAVIGAGKLAWFLTPGRWRYGIPILALCAWAAGSSLAVQPHPLAYFNEAAGGPWNGHTHLVDSHLDWGQDLLELKAWQDQHPEAHPLGLVCFHVVDPAVAGIDYFLPAFVTDDAVPAAASTSPPPGYYAVSVSLLSGMEQSVPDGPGKFCRLLPYACHALAARKPIARAGYSIFIYYVPPAEKTAVVSP